MLKEEELKIKGFTMVEVITTIGIFLILGGLVLPIGLNFYRNQKLNTFSYLFADRVEKARTFAKNQRQDSFWGVYVGSDSYTVFKGGGFESRDQSYDETYKIPAGIEVDQDEVVFEKLFARPVEPISFTISGAPQTNVVSVNSVGRVRLGRGVSLVGD